MNKPFFAFDIDDVVFSVYAIIADQLKVKFGIEHYEPKGFKDLETLLSPSDYRYVIDSALCERVDEIVPIYGAIDFIRRYQSVTGNQIVFITSRHPVQISATNYMLEKWMRDIDYRVRFVKEEGKTKGEVAVDEGVEVFIEDRVKYSMDVASRGIMVLLPSRSWNVKYQDPLCCNKIIRVRDYNDINLIFSTLLRVHM